MFDDNKCAQSAARENWVHMQLGLDGAFTDFPETQHNYLECRNNINASNPTSNPNATILVSADSPGGPINASEVSL